MYHSYAKNILLIAVCVVLGFGTGNAQVNQLPPALNPPGRGPGPASDAGPRPFTVGDGVSAPTLLQFVSALPTKEAQEAHAHGTVVIWCVVAPDGVCRPARVARSLGWGLDQSAISAVREWKFKPGKKDGRPVPVAIFLGVYFDVVRGITGGPLDCHPNALGYEDVCSELNP